MNQSKRKIFNILALLMVISMLAATVSAQPSRNDSAKQPEFTAAEAVEVVPASDTSRVIGEVKGATGLADYIVMLDAAPVAFYRGEVDGLELTNAAALGQTKLDVNSDASRAYVDYLEAEHATFVSKLDAQTGREVEVVFDYYYAFNGMAVTLTPSEAAAALYLPGVRQIQRDYDSYIDTDAGPEWIGADHVWDGSATGGFGATQGEGVIAGILDTGLNMDHPSFADIGGDGYDHNNPNGSGNYVGLCDSAPGTWVCNDKLIGYWIMTGETTEDTDGHGSHTGSTTAGNHLTTTMMISASIEVEPARFVDTINTYQYRHHISGVAPHANIIGYDVCNDIGGCPNAGSVAAIDQAILDGVDVINFSIGGGASDPWTDATSMAFLGAYEAGIVPVTSAGNAGPGAGTIGSPNNAPWMLAVGANFHNRAFPNAVVSMTGGDTTPPADISGAGFASGHGPAPIVYAEDAGDAQCLTPFAAGTWTNNEIVVCDRGTIARVEKGVNVLAGGAGGLILANSSASQTLNGDPHALPAVQITYDDGVTLKAWLATGAGHMATIQGSVVNTDASNGDQMASFSSRGPNTALLDIIKPDVTAPGVDILAAYKTNAVVADDFQQEFGIVSGTSMASPHTAGAAALMRALHPDWSVAEIIAALVATGDPEFYKEDDSTPADPFDLGGGQVDLTRAGRTNLTLDETAADFLAANPASGGDPKSLNIATMANSRCLSECMWTRTLTSTVDWPTMYDTSASGENGLVVTVEPANFVIPAFGSQVITVTADVSSIASYGVWTFGSVYVEEVPQEGEELYGIRLPVAVIGTASVVPESIEIDTRRNAGSQLEVGLQGGAITNLTVDNYGLVLGTVVEELLPQDPTDDDPYDSPEGTFFVTVTVPADTFRLVAETIESTAVDLDLFVGTGDTPSEATQICSSTTSSYIEYCDVGEPAAGTYWILVQNWLAGASPPDTAVLSYAVVTETDAGNMMVTGPATNPAGTPFDVRIFWDTPSMMYGDHWYGGFALGTSAGTVGDLGSVPVDIIRWEDDVAKEPSSDTALLGDTITYTIMVKSNITPEDLTYWITDTIPGGMTYVTGTAAASAGTVDVTDGVLTWTGVMDTPYDAAAAYELSDSVSDVNCDTGFGGYVDLEGFGIFAQAAITGDTVIYSAFPTGDPISFYGLQYTGFGFSDDGFAIADTSDYGGSPWTPQTIPDSDTPNNVAAMYWNDFQIVYDGTLNHGVSLATAGSPGGVIVIEYDDIQPYGGGNPIMDMEVVVARAADDTPGAYEVVFAYDNVAATPSDATIGVENQPGDVAVALVNNDDPTGIVSDGYMVCFDWRGPQLDDVTITFDVTVDEDVSCPATITNTVYDQTDNPGSMEYSHDVDVVVTNCVPTGVTMSDISGQSNSASLIPLMFAIGVAVLFAGAIVVRRRREV